MNMVQGIKRLDYKILSEQDPKRPHEAAAPQSGNRDHGQTSDTYQLQMYLGKKL
jgi:hypothetical protein